jgi:hypothetical protein
MPKRLLHFLQQFLLTAFGSMFQDHLSIQGQYFPLFLFNLKEKLKLGLQEMKALGRTNQGPLLILRKTDMLCTADARITITQFPVYLRPKQTLQTQGTN